MGSLLNSFGDLRGPYFFRCPGAFRSLPVLMVPLCHQWCVLFRWGCETERAELAAAVSSHELGFAVLPAAQPHGVDHSHTGVVSSCSSGWWQCAPTTIGGGGFRSSVCWSSWWHCCASSERSAWISAFMWSNSSSGCVWWWVSLSCSDSAWCWRSARVPPMRCCRTFGESHRAKSKISLVLNPNRARNLVPRARSMSPEIFVISSLEWDPCTLESSNIWWMWPNSSVESCAPCWKMVWSSSAPNSEVAMVRSRIFAMLWYGHNRLPAMVQAHTTTNRLLESLQTPFIRNGAPPTSSTWSTSLRWTPSTFRRGPKPAESHTTR